MPARPLLDSVAPRQPAERASVVRESEWGGGVSRVHTKHPSLFVALLSFLFPLHAFPPTPPSQMELHLSTWAVSNRPSRSGHLIQPPQADDPLLNLLLSLSRNAAPLF